MALEREPHSEKLEQSVSLAELSRQYLQGNIGVNDYLAIEREVAPRLGVLSSIEAQIEASIGTNISRQQLYPSGRAMEDRRF